MGVQDKYEIKHLKWGDVHVNIYRVIMEDRKVFHNIAIRGHLGWDGTLRVREIQKAQFLLFRARLFCRIRGIRY